MAYVKKAWSLVRQYWHISALFVLTACFAAAVWFRFPEPVSESEATARLQFVQTATDYLGYQEADGSHRVIIDIYNSRLPRARDYEVTYEDSWCAAYVSAVSILCGTTDRIPTECSCGQMIEQYRSLGRWVECDWYTPLPGDIIFYDWNSQSQGECTGWPEHVGIVTDVFGPVMKVIEGNRDDCVTWRYLFLDDPQIRGYGIPDYSH